MRAVQLKEADLAAAVAESDQILAQDADLQRQILQVVGKAHRLPEAAHVFATGRLRADMGQLGVLSRDLAIVIAAVARLQKRSPGRHQNASLRIS
jgi:hypothetical protein